MKKYTGYVAYLLEPKNKLEDFFQNYIKNNFDGKVFDVTEIEEVKTNILKRVAGMNLDHAKCTPINVAWWTPKSNSDEEIKDWVLGGCGCISFSFLCSKKDE